MCGIVGAVTERSCTPILLEGLRRLEYRGYDSAGVATVAGGELAVLKSVGKVVNLQAKVDAADLQGHSGIAHTRWATHGLPSEQNAHPHTSEDVAVVHNGIIENYEALKQQLVADGYTFVSQTDTEVIAHLFHQQLHAGKPLLEALDSVIARLDGAFAIAVLHKASPNQIAFARKGSPLVIGVGLGENYLASDQLALKPVTDRFMFLEEGDHGVISSTAVTVFDASGAHVQRSIREIKEDAFDASKGEYKHFMLKEIYEQPAAIQRCLAHLLEGSSSVNTEQLKAVDAIQIIACGTSYHAGLIAKLWIEELVGVPVLVEVASEFRYRKAAVLNSCLFLTISQSGETADTLAALRASNNSGYVSSLAICNVDNSSLVRESDMSLLTYAGPEIGVASTKAFTTQLTVLAFFTAMLAQAKGFDDSAKKIREAIQKLPILSEQMLGFDGVLKQLSSEFADRHHALFLGRGAQYPVAMEGALKLKEISYIHAEAYAAGELKHGPIALVDEDMPVIAIAPNNDVFSKVKSNLEEVKARGGKLYVFADEAARFEASEGLTVIALPSMPEIVAPILYTIPLQLLSYHVAIVKGTDVDQPRNLAKSVTVE